MQFEKIIGGVETKKKDLNLFFYKYKNMKRLILKIWKFENIKIEIDISWK